MTLVLAARRQIGYALGRAAGGLAWLLRDEFTTDLAAGSVNGTAAEPGPGTRTVVDTGNKLSLSGGAVSISGGTGPHDPGIWLSGITRAAGRLVVGSITVPATTLDTNFGWDSNQSGELLSYINLSATATIRWFTPVSVSRIVGAYTATTYKLAVILRASGAFGFIAGGAYSNWTLLWLDQLGSNATVYPGMTVNAAASTAHTAAFIRVPDALWLPTPLASDGFGSAFGTTDGLGHAEGIAGGIGAGGGGVAWSNVGSTWSVSGGKAINTPSLGSNVVVNGTFDTDTDWTKGAGWLIGSGVATKTASAGSSLSETVRSTTPEQWYKATFTVAGEVANGVYALGFYALGFYDLLKAAVIPGTYSQTGFASSITNAGVFANINTANITVDNIGFQPMTLPELMTSFDASTADVLASVHITWTDTTQAGIILRANSSTLPTDFILVLLNTVSNSERIQVIKCLAGTYAVVSTTGVTYLANAPLTVCADGSAIRVYYNNAFIVAVTISDAGIVNNTLHGMFSTNASNTLDNFTCYATGTGGEYATLDQYIQ